MGLAERPCGLSHSVGVHGLRCETTHNRLDQWGRQRQSHGHGELVQGPDLSSEEDGRCVVEDVGAHVDGPEQCAALNRTNINPQLLTLEAALSGKKEYVYQAALLDPHTSAVLSIDETISLCDEMIEAHGDYLPKLS